MLKLCSKLSELFSENPVDIDQLRKCMEEYDSNKSEWQRYAHFDPHQYTRNLVDAGNGKYNLMILCWGPGMGSRVHDHSNSHCFVKVLDGQLKETRYGKPIADAPQPETGINHYSVNEVSYMSDELGLHRVENPSHSDGAVSLHLYVPPFDRCNTYCERTGIKSEYMVSFYSRPMEESTTIVTKADDESVSPAHDNFNKLHATQIIPNGILTK